MFSKISRYRKLRDVVTVDARGRSIVSKGIRLLPETAGTFQHLVEAGDRLDHLAFKYYGQPRKWWRICDANPAFVSPQSLLGHEPVLMARYALEFTGTGQPPWAVARRNLAGGPGVERVQFLDDIRIVPQQQTISGQSVTVNVERHDLAALVTFNRLSVAPADLTAILAAAGFGVKQPTIIGQVGHLITVPPDAVS